jgi:hypothetical protein
MTFNEFVERFDPVRNKFDLSSPIQNMMFENDDDEQSEFIESRNEKNVWSYDPERGLINGYSFKRGIIGYVVCKKECTFPRGTITVKI